MIQLSPVSKVWAEVANIDVALTIAYILALTLSSS